MPTKHLTSGLILILFLCTSAFCTSAVAQVKVKRGAVVYTGSASNTSAPATVDEKTIRDATPEWQTIQDEGIDPSSARGKQLIVKMNQRIREAVRTVASSESRDMVTRKKDLADAQGKEVVDLTQQVVDELGS